MSNNEKGDALVELSSFHITRMQRPFNLTRRRQDFFKICNLKQMFYYIRLYGQFFGGGVVMNFLAKSRKSSNLKG